jgi:hypothetical protein
MKETSENERRRKRENVENSAKNNQCRASACWRVFTLLALTARAIAFASAARWRAPSPFIAFTRATNLALLPRILLAAPRHRAIAPLLRIAGAGISGGEEKIGVSEENGE